MKRRFQELERSKTLHDLQEYIVSVFNNAESARKVVVLSFSSLDDTFIDGAKAIQLAENQTLPRIHKSFLRCSAGTSSKSTDRKKLRKKLRKKIKQVENLDTLVVPETQLEAHLLTPEQLKVLETCNTGIAPIDPVYRFTLDQARLCENRRMLAIDCEMCRTTTGLLECTRISVVDEACEVIYDELVVPLNPIIDYLTPFSGITKEMMDTCSMTLETAREQLRNLIPAQTILIGHSIEHDLRCIGFHHDRVIDTCTLYRENTIKLKLKTLADHYLNEQIQMSSGDGHCSAEDAIATMKLAKLKLVMGQNLPSSLVTGRMLFSQKLQHSAGVEKIVLIDSVRICQQFGHGNVHVIPSVSNLKVLESVSKQTLLKEKATFIWARCPDPMSGKEIQKQCLAAAETLGDTDVLICLVSPDLTTVEELHQKRISNQENWTAEDKVKFDQVLLKAQMGQCAHIKGQ